MYREVKGETLWQKTIRFLRIVLVLPWQRLAQQGLWPTLIWGFDRGRLLLRGVPTLRFARIRPGLLIGGQISARGWQKLQRAGVTAVVNMRSEHDDRANGVAVPAERYLHLPTVDDTPVDLEALRRGADWIAAQVAEGGAVYIHCAAGSGRAPSMGAAYLIAHANMSTDEALATIKRARPFIRPLPSQVARLREFEARVRQNGQDGQ